MKFTDFLLIVSQMRDAQRRYYSNRTQSNLLAAKASEKEVDDAIRKATDELGDIDDTRQAELFPDFAIRAVTQRRTDSWSSTVDDRLERRHR